ncbi:hypothetical protein QD460_25505 [Rhizobium jaguaris]|uniref:hypothetical protein n=1 Tax=Rhizobium jaguaris TaxID=1312183 RepID=UPI0039BEE44C
MSTHDNNPLLGLYGTPRAVVHKRTSVRAKPLGSPEEQDNPEKLGLSMISLTSLKDHNESNH